MKRYIVYIIMVCAACALLLAACGPKPAGPAPQEPDRTPAQSAPLPEKVSGADLIRERVWRGESAGTWLPLLADVTWEELAEPVREGFDCVWEACGDIFSYVEEQGQSLTEEEYQILLSHVQGLDGAYAEGYNGMLYDLYVLNPACFARIVLDQLPPDQQEAALGGLLYDWGYCHDLDGMGRAAGASDRPAGGGPGRGSGRQSGRDALRLPGSERPPPAGERVGRLRCLLHL